MFDVRIAKKEEIDDLMTLRFEMLRATNDLESDFEFDEDFVKSTREYFLTGDTMTVFALCDGEIAGCSSLSFFCEMPTFKHPLGKTAKLRNVYTREKYRRQGVAQKMVRFLIDAAKFRGCDCIKLDATEMGESLYRAFGFEKNESAMSLDW